MQAIKRFYQRYYFSILHAIKAVIAFLIAYILVVIFHKQWADLHPQWLFITIAVIMSSHHVLGLQISKAIFRILGTIAGVIIACCVIILPQSPFITALFLAIAALLFVFIAVSNAKYAYVGTLGMATFCMIALSQPPNFTIAIVRGLETFSGIAIALFVSFLFFPLRSSHLLRYEWRNNLDALTKAYDYLLLQGKTRHQDAEVDRLDSKIIHSIQTQQQLLASTRFEKNIDAATRSKIQKFIQHQRAIYRYLIVLDVAQRDMTVQERQQVIDKQKDFVRAIIKFIHILNTISTHDSISQTLISVTQSQRALIKYIKPGIPAHQTIAFISSRLLVVCEAITHNPLLNTNCVTN